MNTYIDSIKDVNNKDPKFKVGNHVIISKYKNIFAKRSISPNWSGEVFVIKEVKNTIAWKYVINDLNVEKFFGAFYEKRTTKNKSTRT